MNRDGKNTWVVAGGLVLVFLVLIFTVLRPYLFPSKDTSGDNGRSQKQNSENQKKIYSAELWNKITNKDDVIIVDTRSNEDYGLEHIIGARNIPLSEIEKTLPSLDKNKTYVLVDDLADPVLQEMVDNTLPRYGYNNVFFLAGGMANWRNEKFSTINDGNPLNVTDQAKVTYISSDELKKSIEAQDKIFIVDLRKNDAYLNGHIKDAENIYLLDLEEKRGSLPLGKKIVLVDKDGLWAFKGAVLLFDAGVFNVYSLSDGMDAWIEKGYEIVK